jgi:hypothetical protein
MNNKIRKENVRRPRRYSELSSIGTMMSKVCHNLMESKRDRPRARAREREGREREREEGKDENKKTETEREEYDNAQAIAANQSCL